MTAKSRATLNSDADTNLANNTTGDISPADIRGAVKDLADSAIVADDLINGTAKTTPVDADTLALSDSAASGAIKKVTWANVKATLGSTFAALAGSVSQAFAAATLDLGHASDTTIARSAAGVVTIEGVEVVTLSRSQNLTNKTLTDPVITGAILEDIHTISDGAAFEIDPGNGSIQRVTLGASRTPKATNFQDGESVTLEVADGTAYAITWTDATWGGSGVVWVGGSAPTLATTGYTVIELWKIGGQTYGAHVGDHA